jgi:hypothetical protein
VAHESLPRLVSVWPLAVTVPWAPRARRESDEEFRQRLLGSDTPQAQRIVTGVDPRLAAAEAEAAEGEDGQAPPAGAAGDTWGTRLDKLADDELSPEDREAKRNTELWKAGNKAKEFGYKWKVRLRSMLRQLVHPTHPVVSDVSPIRCFLVDGSSHITTVSPRLPPYFASTAPARPAATMLSAVVSYFVVLTDPLGG